ncbi:unnamed protein product [Acanthoscelides obtectus]|uniref:Uncharacterized protein n=1 Tax=Acanthoscelides obtectus TaxID=200917 RepID=A0A9P0PS28_ACAOB|nr:unnamed protein product [Acanthoscelides obtectus]CAK1626992.1 hypothetical protein AOBTE_LOCUS4200 [Acanthoscelides obtectus]
MQRKNIFIKNLKLLRLSKMLLFFARHWPS